MNDHGPIDDKYRENMNQLAGLLDNWFNGGIEPKKVGFALLTYEFGEVKDGRVNYIGNGQRSDVIKALQELIGRWEAQDAK